MVEWLAGNRIRGTSTERTTGAGFNPVTTAGGWKELVRTTLTSNNSTFSVTIPEQKRYYMVLSNYHTTGTANPYMRINADANQYYPQRFSMNGAGDSTPTTYTGYYGNVSGQYSGIPYFSVDHWANKSGKEKLVIRNLVMQNTAGTSTATPNAPNRAKMVGKYTQTGDMSSILIHGGTYYGNATNGSEIVVLGWDPDDTHTDNFWEELASVDLSGGASATLSSGTITAKRYLWVQIYAEVSASSNGAFTFNGDTSTNYAIRVNTNGAATDGIWGGLSNLNFQGTVDTNPVFQNAFIINNSANEKLMMGNNIDQGTAGISNTPNRKEYAGKWTNTSAQITSINYKSNNVNTFGTNSIMKVWGHD